MSLRDVLTGRHTVKGPAPDRLFAITTAWVTLQTEYEIEPTGAAAIVFQSLATSEFETTLRETEELVKATGGDSAVSVTAQDDREGYRWMLLHNPPQAPSVEDLAVGVNAVSSSIETAGHGDRLLCAVFAFEDAKKRRIYCIYNYKRGYWYPYIPDPSSDQGRMTERELQLKAQIGSDLPLEPEIERWFPLSEIPI